MTQCRVAVVGGGIAGLTAAYRLRTLLGPRAVITVIEQSDRLGGKLRTVELGGIQYDVGAEAFLNRRPEARALLTELGLDHDVVYQTQARPAVRAGGHTVELPRRTVLGLPAEAEAVREVLSPQGFSQVAHEAELPPVDLAEDISVGKLLRGRFGDELTDRLVDPLLGGVYAGRVDELGLRATMPMVSSALESGARSLTEVAAGLIPAPAGKAMPEPVFAALRTGMRGLIDALIKHAGADIRLGAPVRELSTVDKGWRLTLGAAAQAHAPADPVLDVDAVVLAVPVPAARRLLGTVAPAAAQAYADIDVASSAVIALALPGAAPPSRSGTLIGASELRSDGKPFTAKAFTYSSAKWSHLSDGHTVLVRGSVGRYGEAYTMQADDDELIARVRDDLAELTGITVPPIDAVVTRWGGGLPQYAVGHLDRVDAIEQAVATVPGLAVAGAALHGVGIPACIATGDAAAHRIAEYCRD